VCSVVTYEASGTHAAACEPQKRESSPAAWLQVFLGAAAVHSNGTVMARIGSATVAMAADARGVPVIICCETYKFVAKVPRQPASAMHISPPSHGGAEMLLLASSAS
jgi:Initiation factor 2 subunit family